MFALAAALLFLVQDARTPVVPAPAPTRVVESQTPNITLAEREFELTELLDACASFLRIPIEYARADVAGRVTLLVPGPLTSETLLDTTNRALAGRGFITVQMPGALGLSVVKLADAPALARLEDSTRIATQAGFVKVLTSITHERLDSISEAVKLVLTKGGAVTAFKDTRSLLIADLRSNVLQALRLVSQLDTSFDDMNVIEVPVAHASSTALTALIERITNAKKAVFGEKGKGALLAHPEAKSILIVAPAVELDVWRGLVSQFDRSEEATTVNYSPRRYALLQTSKLIEQVVHGDARVDDPEPWRMVIDGLTGTLIVTTTPTRHAQIEALLDRLEMVAQLSRKPIRSFPIKNRSVDELHDLLQGLLDAGALKGVSKTVTSTAGPAPKPAEGATAPLTNQAPVPVLPLTSDELGDKVILTVDKPTNRLIAMGEARVLEQLATLIAELDVRQPQVIVEAMVVTLTDNQTRELGVEIQKIGVSGDTQARFASLFGLGSPNPTSTTLPAASGLGFSGVALDPGSFSALVKAFESLSHGRTLTMPKVLVNNNQAASLNSVLQTPYASTNASTTVATTSFGGTLDAGTEISVTPQIADGDQLILDYTVTLSAFQGSPSNPALPPPRQQNKLKSTVTVPDGFTVVVGGLDVASDSLSSTQVPWLGNIPLLGALFSDKSKTENRTRFFVFLRCNVLRSQTFEDLKYASKPDLAVAGVDDGFPKLEPRIIR